MKVIFKDKRTTCRETSPNALLSTFCREASHTILASVFINGQLRGSTISVMVTVAAPAASPVGLVWQLERSGFSARIRSF